MMLTTCAPRSKNSLAGLHDQMNRLFSGFWSGDVAGSGSWSPALDIVELPEEVLVKVEVPGIDPEKVEISVNGDVLEISGEKEREETAEDAKWYRYERRAGSFRRALQLPVAIDAERVEAEAHNGLLTVRLPKQSAELPKRITIRAKK